MAIRVLKNNVISGNDGVGVAILGVGASGNSLEENRVGTDAAGTSALGNGEVGVLIFNDAPGNPLVDNVISGNGTGVQIGEGAAGNGVQGNPDSFVKTPRQAGARQG